MSRYPSPGATPRPGGSDTDQFLPDNAPPSSFAGDRSSPSSDRYSGDSGRMATQSYDRPGTGTGASGSERSFEVGSTEGDFGSDQPGSAGAGAGAGDSERKRGSMMRPFEMKVAQDAIQRHIDQGEITQHDVDAIKDSFRTTGMASTLGAVFGTFGTMYYFRRRRLPAPLSVRLAAIFAMGITGSFAGFACGGVAATLTLRKELGSDAERKVQVLGAIAQETRSAQIEQMQHMRRAGSWSGTGNASAGGDRPVPRQADGAAYPPSSPSSPARARGQPRAGSFGDDEGSELERRAEVERESEVSGGSAARTGAGVGAGGVGQVGLGTPSALPRAGAGAGAGERGPSAWDRIRSGRPTSGPTSQSQAPQSQDIGVGENGAGPMSEYDRQRQREQAEKAQLEREQREFDQMLERERQGGASNDRWR